MYSPKIDPALIPRIHRLAKARNMPMTRLVNELLEHGLVHLEQGADNVHDAPAGTYRTRRKGARDAHTT